MTMKKRSVLADFDRHNSEIEILHNSEIRRLYYAKVGTLRYRRILWAIAYAAMIQEGAA